MGVVSERVERARAELIELAWKAWRERRRNGDSSPGYAQALREMEQARRYLDVVTGGVP